jgi:hypothetical protein
MSIAHIPLPDLARISLTVRHFDEPLHVVKVMFYQLPFGQMTYCSKFGKTVKNCEPQMPSRKKFEK